MIGLAYADDGWVLQRIAEQLLKFPNFTRDLETADAYVYLPYYLQPENTNKITVSLFTHFETHPEAGHKRAKFLEVAENADLCWAMCAKTASELPPEKTFVLPIPADPQFGRTFIDIGILGHEQPFGRKGVDIVEGLGDIPGVRFLYTNGKLPFENLPGFISKLDYVLVTGKVEGGPMCVPEAVAMGKPVIAPDVGWAWDWPCIRYSNAKELRSIIERLAPKHNRWGDFVGQLERYIGK